MTSSVRKEDMLLILLVPFLTVVDHLRQTPALQRHRKKPLNSPRAISLAALLCLCDAQG